MTDRVIRVFISSPSDVRPERQIAVRVCARLDREFAYQFRVQPLVWEREPLVASGHFQDGIPDPSTTDIVVVILWLRLGMPLPDAFTGAVSGRVPVTGTEWEFEDALAAARATKRPDLLMYRKQAAPLQALNLDDRDAALAQINQREALLDFLKRWFDGDDNAGVIAASHLFIDEAAFEEMLETHLRELLRKRLQGGEGVPLIAYPGNPFRGLQRFEAEHTAVFFGRARARAELRERLARRAAAGSGFVVVVGASGSGKSSLVRAGLVPDLKLPGMIGNVAICRVATMLPSDIPGDPVTALAAAIVAALPELAELLYDAPTLASQLRASSAQAPFAVAQGLRAAGRAAGLTERGEARLLVVVDQLEELFTGIASSPEMRATFADALAALASSGQVWVVATLRSDFSDRIEQVPALALLCDGDSRHLLLPPDAAEIGQMIRMPAREAGLRFEVDERSGVSLDDVLREAASRQPGALPLLEFALDQLWHGRTESGFLTYDHYNALGGLEGAIGRRAAEVLAGLPPDVAASWPGVLRALVAIGQGDSAGATARDVALARFSPGTPARALIDAFLAEGARLLVTDDTGTRLRVAHEALLTHWEAARSQIERDRADLQLRARLEQAEERWRTARPDNQPDLLLPHGLPLSEAEDYQHRRPEDLTAEVLAFITLSTAAEAARVQQRLDEERRRVEAEQAVERERLQRAAEVQRLEAMAAARLAQRNRWAAAVLALLLMGAGGLAIYADREATRANTQTTIAEQNRADAETARIEADRQRDQALLEQSGYLASVSRRETDKGSAMTAASLALEALPRDLAHPKDRPYSAEAEAALSQAIVANKLRLSITPSEASLNSMVLTPDGTTIATFWSDGLGRVFDARSGRELYTIPNLDPRSFDGDRVSADGQKMIVRGRDAMFIISPRTGVRGATLRGQSNPQAATFSGDSRVVFSLGTDSTIRRWDASTGEELAAWTGMATLSSRIVANHDGSRVVAVTPSGQIVLFSGDLSDPIGVLGVEGHSVAFSADGQSVATGQLNGDIRIWDADDGTERDGSPFKGHLKPISGVSFADNDANLVSASEDGTVRVWDLNTGRVVSVFTEHRLPVKHLSLVPGSDLVLTADDESARLWRRSTGKQEQVVSTSPQLIRGAALVRDGSGLITHDGSAVSVFDITGGTQRFLDLPGAGRGGKLLMSASADGRHLLARSGDMAGTVAMYDLERGVLEGVLEGHQDRVTDVAWTLDGSRMMTGSLDRTAALWDRASRGRLWQTPPQETAIEFVDLSADGRLALTVAEDPRRWDVRDEKLDGPVRIWNAATGAWLRDFRGHPGTIDFVRFVGPGDRVVSSGKEGKLLVWHADTGVIDRAIDLPKDQTAGIAERVTDFVALPGRDWIAAKTYGRFLLVNLQDGETRQLQTLKGFSLVGTRLQIFDRTVLVGLSGALALFDTTTQKRLWLNDQRGLLGYRLSHDGQHVAVTLEDGSVDLLLAASGNRVAHFAPRTGPTRNVVFGPGDQSLVSLGDDARLALQPMPLAGQDLIDEARAIIAFDLGPRDREILGVAKPAAFVAPSSPGPAVSDCDRLAGNPFDPGHTGTGVQFSKIDAPSAVAACEKAVSAAPEDGRTLYQLGRAQSRGGQVSAALLTYQRAVAHGYLYAQTAVAEMLTNGEGVTADPKQAFNLKLKAAEAGSSRAQYQVGLAYRDGIGVTKDQDAAWTWLERSARAGFVLAQDEMGDMLSDPGSAHFDEKQALYWYFWADGIWTDMIDSGVSGWRAAEKRAALATRLPAQTTIAVYRQAQRDIEAAKSKR